MDLDDVTRPPPQQRSPQCRQPPRTGQGVDLLAAATAGGWSGPLDHEADADHAVAAGQGKEHRIG